MKTPLFSVPVPSTSFGDDPRIAFDNVDLRLEFRYLEAGQSKLGAIVFSKVRSFRHRGEPYCTAWHIEGNYDVLVEIHPSGWVDELTQSAPEHQRSSWVMRHFIIYLDSFGCLEVVAEAAELGALLQHQCLLDSLHRQD